MKFKSIILVLAIGAVITGAWWWITRPVQVTFEPTAPAVIPNREGRAPKIAKAKAAAPASPAPANKSLAPLGPITDVSLTYPERFSALRSLPMPLAASDAKNLLAFVQQPGPQDGNNWEQALKNEVLDKLCESNTPRLRELLTGIYEDRSQDAVLRDYALQHLIEIAQRMAEAGGQGANADFQQIAPVLWEATHETDSSIAGTALLGLSRLSDTEPEFDRDRVAQTAEQLVEDHYTGSFARTAAIQVSARMNLTNTLAAIWETAQSGSTIPLQTSAIAALGLLNDTTAVPFLTDLMNGGANDLKPAAKQALFQLAEFERQKAAAAKEQLERQKAEEWKKHGT